MTSFSSHVEQWFEVLNLQCRNRALSWETSYIFSDFDVKTFVKVETQSIFSSHVEQWYGVLNLQCRNRALSWEISYISSDFDVKTSVKVETQSISRTLMILSCLLHLLSRCEVFRIREVSSFSRFFDVKLTFKLEISQVSMNKSSMKKCETFNIEYQSVRSLVRLLKFECEIVDLQKIQILFSKFSMIEKASRERSNKQKNDEWILINIVIFSCCFWIKFLFFTSVFSFVTWKLIRISINMSFKENVFFIMIIRSRDRANVSNSSFSIDITISIQSSVSISIWFFVSISIRFFVSISIRFSVDSSREFLVVTLHRFSVDASSRFFVTIESSNFEKSDDFVEKSSSFNEKSFFFDEFFTFASVFVFVSVFVVIQLATSFAFAVIQKRLFKVKAFSSAFLFSQIDELNSNIWFENDEFRQFFEFVAIVSTAIAIIVAINVAFSINTRVIKIANKTKKNENAWKHVINDEEVKISRHCALYTFHQIKKSIKQRSQSVMYIDAQRFQIFALYTYEVFAMNVCTTTNIKHFRTVWRLLQKAKNRDFDSKSFSILKIEYVQDATRSNRSIICDFAKKKAILISNKSYISNCVW